MVLLFSLITFCSFPVPEEQGGGGVTARVGEMLELFPASLAPSILLLPPPGTKPPLYSQQLCSITPHTAPFSSYWLPSARLGKSPPESLSHIQGVDCSFYTSGLVWGFNRRRENFQARRLCPHQFLSTQTRSVVEEVSQVELRGGSRLGRAASQVRRGGGRCSRWPR